MKQRTSARDEKEHMTSIRRSRSRLKIKYMTGRQKTSAREVIENEQQKRNISLHMAPQGKGCKGI